jgi:hypothetical protein
MDPAMRQVRAIVLMTGALIAIAAVSIGYLHPSRPAAPGAAKASVANQGGTVTWTEPQIVQNINLSGTDGGYFVWTRPGFGSGGNAAP